MSTTIEQNVVEFQFDNRQFERNVSTTMSTLDKLKQKLNFTGASKGLEDVGAAAKNINMNGLGSAVEQVSIKFSALQVMGVTALANITNSAVNAGKRIVSALTIDPIRTGFQEYETQINSVQTILANTASKGTTIDDVNKALEELNKYADMTIYNFTEMTRNIGTFTAAGIDLDTSVNAIQGIANLAAVSGSTSQQASTAMYQLSQALSSGTVRLMDWNSVVNAGMGGEVFQNALKETSEALGTGAEAAIKAGGSFRESLSQGWLTAEVLTETLKKFTTSGATEYVAKYAGITAEAVTAELELAEAQYGETEAIKAASKALAEKTGKNADEIASILEFAKTATDAATKVKTFTQLWDVLKEAAQSGWSQTWKLIIGDFEQAKGLLTPLSDFLTGIINTMSDFRNDVLESALGKTFVSLADKVYGVTESTTAAVEAITDLGDVVNRVINGEFGTGADRIDALTKAGFNYYTVQNKVNEALGASKRYSDEQVEAQDKLLGTTTKQTVAISDLNDEQKEQLKVMIRMADLGQGIEGYNQAQIAALKSLAKQAKKTGLTVDEFVDNLDQINGRWLMIEGIKNLGKALVDTFTALKTAWQNVFPPKSIEQRAQSVFDLLAAFHKLTRGVRDTVYANGELTETGDKLRRTFEGIFAVIKTVTTILSGGFKMAVKVVSTVLRNFNLNVLDITAVIGDAFVSMYKTVSTVVDTISTFLAEHITAWIEKFRESEIVTTVANWFSTASDTISEAIGNITTKFENFSTSGFVTKLQGVYDFFAGVGRSLHGSETVVTLVDLLKQGFSNLKNLLPKIEVPKFNLDNYKWYTNFLEKLDSFDFSSIQGVFSSLGSWIKSSTITKMKTQFKNLAGIDWDTFKLNTMSDLASFWLSISDKVSAAIEKCKEIFQSIAKFIFGTKNVDLPSILDLASKVMGLAVLFEALKVLQSFTSPFDNITDALNNFASAIKWNAVGDAFKALALVLVAVTACIVILASMPDMNKAWNAVGMLGTMLVGMGIIVAALMFMASKMPAGDVVDIVGVSLSMLTLIGTVWLLTEVLQKIDELKLRNPVKTFTSLGLMLLGLAAGIKIIAAAGSSSFKSVAAIITLVSAMKLILGVIEDYDKFDWTGKSKAIWHMIDMLMVLSLAINIASRGVKADAGAKGLALLLLAMVVSLKLLLGVIEDFAKMPIDTLVKGGAVVATLFYVMTWMMVEINNANKSVVLEKGQKSVNNFVGLATALLAVVAAIWVLGKTPTDVLVKGGLTVAGILYMFTRMLTSVGKTCAGLKMPSIIALLVGIMLIVAEVGGLLHVMKNIPWQQALGSAAALSMVLTSTALVLRILGSTKCNATDMTKWIGAMAGLAIVTYVLADVIKSMQGVAWADSVGNVAAMSLMLVAMSAVLVILNKMPINGGNVIKSLGALFGVCAVVAGLSIILANMSGVENAIENATALSILALALSVCTPILAAAGMVAPSATVGVTALTVLAVVLGALVLALSHIPNMDVARENAITLSGLAVVLSLCTLPLAAAGLLAPSATVGATLLTALAFVLGALVGALSLITGVDAARQNAITLSNLAIVLSLCTLPLALASLIAPAAMVGAVLLVTLAATLGVLVYSLSKIKETEQARGNADIMIDIITSLTEMVVKIGALGKDALYAVDALGWMVVLVKKLGDFARRMGKLSENNPEFEKFITTGLEMFKKLGRGLGEVISEFGAGLVSSLPEIGSKLTEFSENMVGFVEVMQLTTDDIINRADMLAKAIAALVKSDVINSLSEDFGGSLPEMGTNLSKFAENLSGFFTIMADVKPETLDGVNALCSALQALTDANLSNAWAQILPGDQSLTTFGKSINDFAGSIKGAAESLKGITDEDVENITRAATAGEALADLAMAIPSKNGFLQDWIGEKDLATFGESAVAFGKCLVDYSRVITNRTVDADAITASATAGQALSDLANSLPDVDGVWQDWAGEQSLATFGGTLVEFAEGLVGYSDAISGANINVDDITKSAEAVTALTGVAEALPETGGKWQEWFGEQNLATFGSQLTAFATGLINYTNVASGIDDAKIKAIENSGTAVEKLVDVVELVPTEGSVFDMLFGSTGQSGQSFGDALSAMAIGINRFCSVAAGITTEKLSAIDDIGGENGAIEKIKTAINAIPEGVDSSKTAMMATAVADLAAVASFLGSITVAQYDYSGVDTLKTAILNIATLISGDSSLNAGELYSAFFDLKESMMWAGVAADALSSMNGYTYTGIDSFKAAISSLAEVDIEGVISKFTGKTESMADSIGSLLEAMTSAMYAGEDDLYTAAETLVTSALDGLASKETDFETMGETFATKLLDAFKNQDTVALASGRVIANEVVDGVDDKATDMETAGKDLGKGLVRGIEAKYQAAYDAGYALGQKAVQGEKDGQASNSPSKLTIQAGKWFGEGLVIGINKMGESVYSAGHGLGDTAVKAVSSTISRIASAIDSDMDVQPTIRPVLDLSNIKTGANAIDGMLASTSSVGVLSKVGAISTAMNRRGQNGGNAEVVSAIDKLYRKLDNVGNTSYNINGVTYDDGSNIAEAVRTIARAAIVERRM